MSNNNDNKEQNMVQCKICKELKLRIQDGMYDHKNKRWIDKYSSPWNGKCCPTCHQAKQAENQRNKRKNNV